MRFCVKIIVGVTGIVTAGVVTVAGMFYLDSGRQFLLDHISKFLHAKYKIKLEIQGVNRSLTKANKLFLQLANGMSVHLSDVTRNASSITIDKFVFTDAIEKEHSETSKNFLPTFLAAKKFIKGLRINSGYVHTSNKTYRFNNLKYYSVADKDFLSGIIDEDKSIKITIDWNKSGKICFENVYDFSGILVINNLNSDLITYKLTAKNKDLEIVSDGDCEHFDKDIRLKNIVLKYNGNVYTGSGNIFLEKQLIQLSSQVALKQLCSVSSLPNSLKDLSARIIANYSFNGRGEASVLLKNNQQYAGKLQCAYNDNQLSIDGDINQVELYGFRFNKLNCFTNDFKNIDLSISGDDITISSNFDKDLHVKYAELVSSKGVIRSTAPFSIGVKCSFDFDIPQLDLLNKFAPVDGSGSGSITYKDGKLLGCAKFTRLKYDNNITAIDLEVLSDEKGVTCQAKAIEFSDLILKRFKLNANNSNFDISGSVNNHGSLKIKGNLRESDKYISNINGSISAPSAKLIIKDGVLDLKNKHYALKCFLLGKRNQNCGSAELNWSQQQFDASFDKFQLIKLAKVFNKPEWKFVIDGKTHLQSQNGLLIGNGKLTCSGIIANANTLNIGINVSKEKTNLNLNIKKKTNLLAADLSLPISILSTGEIIKNSGSLNCRISGKIRLEELFELTDQSDLKGVFDCDMSISGSLNNPVTTGTANLNNAYIAVGDLVLKNGNISLAGKGKRIIVKKACFIDDNKHTAVVTGEGSLFFKNWIPDIKTDLQLAFSNFTLFDGETMKIVIDGPGKMTGPISNLKLTGNVTVPQCEIRSYSTDDSYKSEIEFENVVYPGHAHEADNNKDFFDYQINMHCPSICLIGDIFNVKFAGDLVLSSYLQQATLIGDLRLQNGRLNLFGKRMTFVNGKVTFLKEFPFDPKADLVCRRNFGNINVSLNIKNSPTKGVHLHLSSTPTYGEDVILSTILFGKEIKYLSVGEAAQLAHALASLNKNGYILSVLNTIQNTGIVDSISFSTSSADSTDLYTNTQNSSSQNNVNVSAGKYIHDNIYVSVNKKDEQTTFDIDLTLSPTVSLKANTAGEVGVSWKYRY